MMEHRSNIVLICFILNLFHSPLVTSFQLPPHHGILHSSFQSQYEDQYNSNLHKAKHFYPEKSYFAMKSGMNPDMQTSSVPKTESGSVQRFYSTYQWTTKDSKQTYDINYRVEGPEDGKPILLIHGFGANANHFRFQFPALVKEGYRVYAIDMLGFGASPKPANEVYSIELWTELMVDFIQSMSTSQKSSSSWVIGGNSIGGLVSLNTCKEIPELINGCVLFNASGGMSIFRYSEYPWFLRPILYFVQKVVLGDALGGKYFDNFRTRENVEAILKSQGVYRDVSNVDEDLLEILLEPGSDPGAKDVFLRVFGGDAGITPESVLPFVQCPILALWGTEDPWVPIDTGSHPGNQYVKYNDLVQLVPLQGVGHCPQDEAPDLCHDSLLPWLETLKENKAAVAN